MVSRKLFQFSLAPEPVEAAPLAEVSEPVPVPVPVLENDPAELSHLLRSGRPSLGSLLVGAGHVTEDQVKDALAEGIRTGERLGEVLVRRRVVTDEVIAELLASQWQVPFVKTAALSVDPTAIRQFPHRVARELDAVPIGFERDGVVLVAIAEPSEDTFRRLSERLPDSSCVVIARSALDSLLESRLYAAAPEESESIPEPEPEPQSEPVAVEATPPDSFAWGSVTEPGVTETEPGVTETEPGVTEIEANVTEIEPSVPLLDSFDEPNEAHSPLLFDEPEHEPEPEFEPQAESEPELELESEPESGFGVYGWEPSTPVGEVLDPVPVASPTPDQSETAAELPPVYADGSLPSGIDAAMASITAASTDLENIRSEVAAVGRALELVQQQLAERDAQLAERDALLAERDAQLAESEAQREAAERSISEERETGRQLQAELDSNSSLIAVVREQVAGLSERLESIAPAGAEPTEQ